MIPSSNCGHKVKNLVTGDSNLVTTEQNLVTKGRNMVTNKKVNLSKTKQLSVTLFCAVHSL